MKRNYHTYIMINGSYERIYVEFEQTKHTQNIGFPTFKLPPDPNILV